MEWLYRRTMGVLQHENGVSQAVFSPNGKTIFTAGLDKTGRLFDTQTGQPIGLPWQHPAAVVCAAFSPDGKTMITGCEDGKARLWAAETGMLMGPPLPHPKSVTAVAFSPTLQCRHGLRRQRRPHLGCTPVAGTVRRLVRWVQVETGMEFDAQGAVHTLDATALAHAAKSCTRPVGRRLPRSRTVSAADRHYRIALAVCRWANGMPPFGTWNIL